MNTVSKNPELIRQSVVEIIVLLLQERQRICTSKDCDESRRNVYDSHIYELISGVLLWRYSEADRHKYTGCRYWSEGACESFTRYGKVVTSRTRVGDDALRHEHLFPRKQLTAKLFAVAEPTISSVRELLERFNIAVIVTHGEHQRLSTEGDAYDPWERYRKAGVDCKDKHTKGDN